MLAWTMPPQAWSEFVDLDLHDLAQGSGQERPDEILFRMLLKVSAWRFDLLDIADPWFELRSARNQPRKTVGGCGHAHQPPIIGPLFGALLIGSRKRSAPAILSDFP